MMPKEYASQRIFKVRARTAESGFAKLLKLY